MPRENTGYDPLPEERPGILSRLVRMNRCFLILLVIPATAIAWRPPFAELEQKKEGLRKLEVRREELLVEVARKKEKLELIKHDPSYLEVVSRDLLESQKEGETIVFFKDK